MSRPPAMLAFDIARLGIEAQWVITLRTMGMMGLWKQGPDETALMITEKQRAFAAAAIGAWAAMALGGRPDSVVAAAILPLRRRTSANVRRLARKGPATWKR